MFTQRSSSGPAPVPGPTHPSTAAGVQLLNLANKSEYDASGSSQSTYSRNVSTHTRTGPEHTLHVIDYRVSLPTFLFGAWYFALLAGPERRNGERLRREGQTSIQRKFAAISLALMALLFLAGFGIMTLTYLAKCALNINIFPEPSFMHSIYKIL